MEKIRLYIFHTGKVRVDQAIPLHERNPLAVTGLFRSREACMGESVNHDPTIPEQELEVII